MISQHVHVGHRSTAWLGCLGGALVEGNDVSWVGNTEREEVVEDDDFDEDEDTETEIATVERTGEAVAEVEELIDADELPVVGVGVAEVLQNTIVSHHREETNNWATKLSPRAQPMLRIEWGTHLGLAPAEWSLLALLTTTPTTVPTRTMTAMIRAIMTGVRYLRHMVGFSPAYTTAAPRGSPMSSGCTTARVDDAVSSHSS